MHRDLECSGFTGPHAGLNGLQHLGLSRRRLARSLIALGPYQIPGPLTGYFWWACHGYSLAYSMLTRNLSPSVWFSHSPKSLRGMQTFRLAEGLTHWFAAEHLKANLVSPLEQAPVNIVRAAAGAPFPKQMPAYFRQAQKVKLKAEPDFLAIEGSVYHVLESKGRSDFLNNMIAQTKLNSARNEGLRQICRIRTINGATPETRSACVFAFDNVGTRGQVTDPPETDTYDLQVPFEALVKQAYRTVLDPLFLENRRKLDFGLEGVEFAPGRTFAINSKVLKLVLAVEGEGSARRVVEFLSIRGSEFIAERYENVSMGRDGMALIAPEPNDEFTLGRR